MESGSGAYVVCSRTLGERPPTEVEGAGWATRHSTKAKGLWFSDAGAGGSSPRQLSPPPCVRLKLMRITRPVRKRSSHHKLVEERATNRLLQDRCTIFAEPQHKRLGAPDSSPCAEPRRRNCCSELLRRTGHALSRTGCQMARPNSIPPPRLAR